MGTRLRETMGSKINMGAYDTVSLQITYKNRPKPGGKENFQIWGPMGPHMGPIDAPGEPWAPKL